MLLSVLGLEKGIPAIPEAQLRPGAGPLDRMHNWRCLEPGLHALGVTFDADSEAAAVAGDLDFVAGLLCDMYKVTSGRDPQVEGFPELDLPEYEDERPPLSPGWDAEYASVPAATAAAPADDMPDEPESYPVYTKGPASCIEFLVKKIERSFGLNAEEAVSVLIDATDVLSEWLTTGKPEGSFVATLGFLRGLLEETELFAGLLASEPATIPVAFTMLSSGIDSESDEVTTLVCQVLASCAQLLTKSYLSKTSYEWLTGTSGALRALMRRMDKTANTEIKEAVARVVHRFCRNDLRQVFIGDFMLVASSPTQHMSYADQILLILCRSGGRSSDLVECSVPVELARMAVSYLDRDTQDNDDLKIVCYSVMSHVWSLYPVQVRADHEVCNDMLAHIKKGCKEDMPVQKHALMCLFDLLDSLVQISDPNASPIYRALIFSLVENYEEEEVSEYIVGNMASLLRKFSKLQVGILVEPFLKHMSVQKYYSESDVELLVTTACHASVHVQQAHQLFGALIGLAVSSDGGFLDAVAGAIQGMVTRFGDNDDFSYTAARQVYLHCLKQFSDLLDIDSKDMSESNLGKTQLAVVLLVSQLKNQHINESIKPAVMSIHDKLLRIYGMSNPVMLEIIANIESGPDSRANSAQIPGSRSSTPPGIQHEGNHIQNSAFFPNFGGVAFDPSAIGESDPKKHQFVPENGGGGGKFREPGQRPEEPAAKLSYFPGSSPKRGVKFGADKDGGRVLFPEEEEEEFPQRESSPVKNRPGTPFAPEDEVQQGGAQQRDLDIPSPKRIVRDRDKPQDHDEPKVKPPPKAKVPQKAKPAAKDKPTRGRGKTGVTDKPWLNKAPALVRKAPEPGTQLEKRVREIERLQAKRNAGLKKKQEEEEREKEKSRKLERALKAKRERLAMQHRRKDGDDGPVTFGAQPSKGASPGGAGARGQRHAGLRNSQQAPEIEELVIEALNARLQDNPEMSLPAGFKRVEKKNMEFRPQTPYVVQFAGGTEPPGQEGSAQKLTDRLKEEPGIELPEGYEKVVPSGHETHRLVAEILDEIAYKSLRLHILEPRECKGTRVVAQRDPTVPLMAAGSTVSALSTRGKSSRAPLAARSKQPAARSAEVPRGRSPATAKKGEDGAHTDVQGESPKPAPKTVQKKKKKSAAEARKAGPVIPVVGEIQDKVTKFIGVWVRDMFQSHVKKVESGEAAKEIERKKEAKKSVVTAAAVASPPPAAGKTGRTAKAAPELPSKAKGKAKDPEEAKRQARKQAAHAKKLKEDLARYKEDQAKAMKEKAEEEKRKKKEEREAKERTREQERKRRETQKQKIEEYKAKQAAEKAAAAEEAAEKAKEELARRKLEAKEAKRRNQLREEAKKLKKQQEEEEAAAAAAAEGDALLQKAKTLVATVEKAGLRGLDDAGGEPSEAGSAAAEGGASETESPQEE